MMHLLKWTERDLEVLFIYMENTLIQVKNQV